MVYLAERYILSKSGHILIERNKHPVGRSFMTKKETDENTKCEVPAKKMLEKIENSNKTTIDDYFFTADDVLGYTVNINTARATIRVNDLSRITMTAVGRLVVIETVENESLIARIESIEEKSEDRTNVYYYIFVGFIGTFVVNPKKQKVSFSRAIIHVANIGSKCYALEGKKLSFFMGGISQGGGEKDLTLGQYILDDTVTAYIDGNKLFQRHMALIGSTGCGKSWTIAALIEQVGRLKYADVVLFDIHGEYKQLSYARQMRIASPGDSTSAEKNVVFFPAWFLNFEEILTVFVDNADSDSSTQAMVLSNIIRKRKLEYLRTHGHKELLESFTVDSPIPFDMRDILKDVKYINTELIPGIHQGEVVKGPYFGKFDRFIPRLEAMMSDRRYCFLFEGPEFVLKYDYINTVVANLLGTGIEGTTNTGIKILDFSNIPSDMIPVVIGAIGRFLFQVQFWNAQDKRHPVILVCDEAHLYLPPFENCNEAQRNTVFQFGRIAKEGRKYGITLAVMTQRPSDVNPSILSQCGNIMTLRLTNIIDQQIAKKLMPDGMTGLIEELPLLGIGEIIVIGDAVQLPLKIKVTPASCTPTSATLEFCDEWAKSDHPIDDLNNGVENMRKQKR